MERWGERERWREGVRDRRREGGGGTQKDRNKQQSKD